MYRNFRGFARSAFLGAVGRVAFALLLVGMLAACASPQAGRPKYIFLMIGDGMGVTQAYAAQAYQAATAPTTGTVRFAMTEFPVVGLATTYADGQMVTDSAAAATALATGFKTKNGVLGLASDKKQALRTVAEAAKGRGMRVGIVTSVTINHATPAGFYSHQPSRNNYYEIGMELARSSFDYFGGGGMKDEKGKKGDQPSALDAARANGFAIATTREEMGALQPGQRAYAYAAQAAGGELPAEISRPADCPSLAEFVSTGIRLLENPNGFFFMVEGGKIDGYGHANDAASAIHEVLGFNDAICEALAFYAKHPTETLIVVTADHETGGMTFGPPAMSGGAAAWLAAQKMTQDSFKRQLSGLKEKKDSARFEDLQGIIEQTFGYSFSGDGALALNAGEIGELRAAFAQMTGGENALAKAEAAAVYGSRDPVALAVTRIAARRTGIRWASFGHTGMPVPVMSMGAGANAFGGMIDNTDIARGIMALIGESVAEAERGLQATVTGATRMSGSDD